jgi:hypothetical protein
MYRRTKYDLKQELTSIKEANLYKDERIILSDQKAKIKVSYPADSKPKKFLTSVQIITLVWQIIRI